jgi:hypothetical protein
MKRQPSQQKNNHHLNWERRHWEREKIHRNVRDFGGFVIKMNMFDHRKIHQDLHEPTRPTVDQLEGLLSHLGAYDSQSERTDYLDMAANYMKYRNPGYAGHLLVQKSYILMSPVNQMERDLVEAQYAADTLFVPQLGGSGESAA